MKISGGEKSGIELELGNPPCVQNTDFRPRPPTKFSVYSILERNCVLSLFIPISFEENSRDDNECKLNRSPGPV